MNCTEGELGHIYYVALENTGGLPPEGGLHNRGPFSDLERDLYWYETKEPVTEDPYVFNFMNGFQTTLPVASRAYAWLVHEGNLSPLSGPHERHKRMTACGSASSLIKVSGPPMLYNLCIRKISWKVARIILSGLRFRVVVPLNTGFKIPICRK